MKSSAKVAVITRTKDRNLFLERAIKSVHGQTLRDFVHVIINDGGSATAVDDLLKKHKDLIGDRVKVIHNKMSSGMEAASNKAVKSVDSVFVAIHDDDDTWHPDFLLKTTEHLDKTGSMGVVVTTDKIVESVEGGVIEIEKVERWLPDLESINLYEQCLDNYATPITFIYRRAVYDKIGYYNEELPVNGDWDFAIRFLLEYDIDYLRSEPALANYHHRPKATGSDGNTVFAQADLHRQNMNKLVNSYLRQDLAAGRLGVGYIMNDLRYQQKLARQENAKALENVVRIEGHINYAQQQTENKITELNSQAVESLHRSMKKYSLEYKLRRAVKKIRPRS